MTNRLLLDEMLSGALADQLRARGHDVLAVVTDTDLAGAQDAAVLAWATANGRAVVSRNIKDFVALDATQRTSGSAHGGFVLISTKTFPEDNEAFGALLRSLDKLLTEGTVMAGGVIFLHR